jgi:hypothetical protein
MKRSGFGAELNLGIENEAEDEGPACHGAVAAFT